MKSYNLYTEVILLILSVLDDFSPPSLPSSFPPSLPSLIPPSLPSFPPSLPSLPYPHLRMFFPLILIFRGSWEEGGETERNIDVRKRCWLVASGVRDRTCNPGTALGAHDQDLTRSLLVFGTMLQLSEPPGQGAPLYYLIAGIKCTRSKVF